MRGSLSGSTSDSPALKHLTRTCAPAVQPPMDAQWGVCAVERQYRGRQASGRARLISSGTGGCCEAGLVRGCRLGISEASGVRARCCRGGARGTGVRAWWRRPVGDGGLTAVVHGGRRGRRRRGHRDAERAGRREPGGRDATIRRAVTSHQQGLSPSYHAIRSDRTLRPVRQRVPIAVTQQQWRRGMAHTRRYTSRSTNSQSILVTHH